MAPFMNFFHIVKSWSTGLCLLASLAFAGSLQAQTVVVDGLNGGDQYWEVFGSVQVAPSFRTGPASTSISEIALVFSLSLQPTTVTLALHAADASGKPTGSALASQQVAVVDGLNTYGAALLGTLATVNMAPNRNYALVIRDGSNEVWLRDDSADANAAAFSGGFALVGSGYTTSSDGGAIWNDLTYTPQFRLTVVAAGPAGPASIPTLSEWGVVGLSVVLFGVAAMRLRRRA